MKNVKKIPGEDGYGCSASMYLNGKKIGTYVDYGNGTPENVDYVSKEAEQEMMKVVIDYAKENPNKYLVKLYKDRPQQLKEVCERFKKNYPYIPDKDITIETMASNSIVYIVDAFLKLYEREKIFKTFKKKGYKAIGVKGHQISAYPAGWSDKKILEDSKDEILYSSLDDFIK